MTEQQARDYAVRGALYLDRVRPGWAQELADRPIDIASPQHCIAGRLSGRGSWWHGVGMLGLSNCTEPDNAWNLGMGGPLQHDGKDNDLAWLNNWYYPLLTDQWNKEITNRLEASNEDRTEGQARQDLDTSTRPGTEGSPAGSEESLEVLQEVS